jgi:hypothetical protein
VIMPGPDPQLLTIPRQRSIRPLTVSAVSTAGLLYRAGRRLAAREARCRALATTAEIDTAGRARDPVCGQGVRDGASLGLCVVRQSA